MTEAHRAPDIKEVGGKAVRIGAFGLAPDTSNMGVSALCHSFVDLVQRDIAGAALTVFDHGRGCRRGSIRIRSDHVPVTLCGAVGGKRFYRGDNLHTARVVGQLGPIGRANPVIRAIDACDVVMDASAGDSFSDIYGQSRFRNIVLPKQLAARRSRPLLLLPQTYGPFRSKSNARVARDAVLSSEQAWARDADSLEVLRDLLGSEFDPAIHRLGVDMAFGLPATRPSGQVLEGLDDWLHSSSGPVGFNVSGLVWHLGKEGKERWGFRADYRRLVVDTVSWLLRNTDERILLVPHVFAKPGTMESDMDAAQALLEKLALGEGSRDRVRVVPGNLSEQELKWLIGRCSWFCGTRMHSTIAALSSGVPTASIVYSDKAAGVFDQCGQRENVIDPRSSDNDEALSQFVTAFERRDAAKASLAEALVDVRAKLKAQSESIAAFALRHADR